MPTDVRLRLLDTLDLFGTALGIAAVRQGRTPAQVRALLRRMSGVDAVLDKISVVGAEVRYQRVLDAVAELEALAVSQDQTGESISGFLSRDDTVVARMAAAVDVAEAAGLEPGRRRSRRSGRAPATGGAMAALQPWKTGPGERAAPRLRCGHRPRIAAAVVAGLRVAARGVAGERRGRRGSGRPGGRAGGDDRAPAGFARRSTAATWCLVTGPWMAGVTAVVAALRERLPQHKFVESTDLGPGDAPTGGGVRRFGGGPVDRI